MIGNPQARTGLGFLLFLWLCISCTCLASADEARPDTIQLRKTLQELEGKADNDLTQKHLECIDEYRDCLSMLSENYEDSSHRIEILKKLAEALALDGQSQQEIAIDVVTNIRPKSPKDLAELRTLLDSCGALDIHRLAIGCDHTLLEQLQSAIKMVTAPEVSSGNSATVTSSNLADLQDQCLHLLDPNSSNRDNQTTLASKTPPSIENKSAITRPQHRDVVLSEATLKAPGKEDPASNDRRGSAFTKKKIALSEKTVIPSAWEVGPPEFERILKQKIDAAFDSASLTGEPLAERILLLNEFADRALAACRFDLAKLAIKDACRLFEDEQNPSMPLYLDLIHKSIIIELTEGKFDDAKAHIEECQHLPGGMNSPETEGILMIGASWQGNQLLAANTLQERYNYWHREDAMTPLQELTLVELAELYDSFQRPYKATEILTEICRKRLENNQAPNLRACGLLAYTFQTTGNDSLASSTISQALNDADSRNYSVADTETAWVDYYAGRIAEKENNSVRARRYYHDAERILSKLSCSNGPLANRIKRQLVTLK